MTKSTLQIAPDSARRPNQGTCGSRRIETLGRRPFFWAPSKNQHKHAQIDALGVSLGK
jgi:hypothetical protein